MNTPDDQPLGTGQGGWAERPKTPFTMMSAVTPQATEWLWAGRIPLGELSVLDGDPAVNKSSFTLDLAARISTGQPMPDGTKGVLGGVLLAVGEDSIHKTLPFRLAAAEADMARIAVFEQPIVIPDDLEIIEEAAVKTAARLLIIDPLMAFLGRDASNDQSVRAALTPLKRLAEQLNLAVLMVRHLNKSGGRQSLYRGGGSIGIIASTRSGLLIGKAPGDDGMRVLCHVKSNLGPLAPSLLFEPVTKANGVVGIAWRGECDYTADDLLVQSKDKQGKREEARQLLLNALEHGPVPQAMIKIRTAVAGISWRTMERAKDILGVVSQRQGFGPGSSVLWQMPRHAAPQVEETSGSDIGPFPIHRHVQFGGVCEEPATVNDDGADD